MAEMQKWLFRFKGDANEAQGQALASLLAVHNFTIVDNSLPKMALATGSPEDLNQLKLSNLLEKNWTIVEVKTSVGPPPSQSSRVKSKLK